MSKVERRDIAEAIEIREADGAGVKFAGTAIRWGDLSSPLGGQFRERFSENAFTNVPGGDVVALRDHDPTQILGRTPKTLRLEQTDEGLEFEIDAPDTTAGRDLTVSIKRGDVRGTSFGFLADSETWSTGEDGMALRTVETAELLDVSPTTSPAYPTSDVTVALRSLDAWKIENVSIGALAPITCEQLPDDWEREAEQREREAEERERELRLLAQR